VKRRRPSPQFPPLWSPRPGLEEARQVTLDAVGGSTFLNPPPGARRRARHGFRFTFSHPAQVALDAVAGSVFVSSPARSDDAAIFELLATVGCRLPSLRARGTEVAAA
jgi:hypothetical protein